eukprot:scaffold296_cov102-Amphora_coffeaeformis.AAC.18
MLYACLRRRMGVDCLWRDLMTPPEIDAVYRRIAAMQSPRFRQQLIVAAYSSSTYILSTNTQEAAP